ncbi:MAG: integrase arm-type DNA-binding domain-containing protein [Alphaproteobacteria bacterium]
MSLTDFKIRAAKPDSKPYKLFDSGGLFLLVKPNGSKLWHLKYRYLGKERLYSIGIYPTVSMSQARQERDTVKKLLAEGIDPTQKRKTTRYQKMEASENTLESIARRWFEIKKGNDEHRERSLRRLELYAFPKLGYRPIQDITTLDLVSCLEAVEKRGILETAHRVKQLLQQVFRYAVRRGLITHNPAGDLRDILAFPEKNNFACIHPSELFGLLDSISVYNGDALTKVAMKLLAYTFVRTGELIGARWEEIDWARQEWQIPAERMKMKRDHIVPLARQTIALLESLKTITGNREFIFHAPANKDKHLSNGAILGALRRMGYAGRMTGHGFRALASTILNEQRKYHPDVIERQLAHAERNEVRAAYNRAEYLLERKVMMQEWADYLDGVLANPDKVVRRDFTKGKKRQK